MWAELVIILLLTVANGIFAGAELAIISIRKTRLQELIAAGSRRARAVQALRDEPERFLATVQIGITVVGASAAAFGGASLSSRLVEPLRQLGVGDSSEQVAFVSVVGLISFLSLVVGELVPKSLALKYSEPYGLFIAKPLAGLAWLGRPVIWFLTVSSNAVLRLFGDRTTFTESRLSPDELQNLVEEATKTGMLNARAGEIASRAFDLQELTVGEVMVPRSRIVALARQASSDEVKRVLLEQGHSRMPVYDGSIDQIVGYAIAKDLLALVWEKDLVVLEDVIRPAYFVPETKRAVDALYELQQRRTQLAIVVDETGGVSGIVTIEDLVEEVVGEIFSEHDQPVEMIRAQPDGSILLQGTAPIREVNRVLQTELPEGDGYSTVAGLMLYLSGRIPDAGTIIKIDDGSILEVVDASPRRVRTLRLRKRIPESPEE
jgi:putative hemolysin